MYCETTIEYTEISIIEITVIILHVIFTWQNMCTLYIILYVIEDIYIMYKIYTQDIYKYYIYKLQNIYILFTMFNIK